MIDRPLKRPLLRIISSLNGEGKDWDSFVERDSRLACLSNTGVSVLEGWKSAIRPRTCGHRDSRRERTGSFLCYIPRCFFRISESLMDGSFGASSNAFLNEAVASSCLPILSKVSATLEWATGELGSALIAFW